MRASAFADALHGRYTIERELGRGGMATVYLARDCKHDRPVALKALHPELAAALGQERFLREIHTTARLQHPHILTVLDSGEASGLLWYTMPYVAGESLRHRLRREVQLPLDVAVGFGRQIAGALDYAHQRGVIHRDIKPENVLLSGDQVLLADFGIAKAVDAAGGEKLTGTGLSLGTPAYMSPEQATASPVDARADVYSLGCVVYEMLVGDPPFAGSSPRAILARHALDPVPSIRTARPAVPPHLEQAISRALAKVPADRFATAGEFGAALELREDAERARTLPAGPTTAARRRSRLLFVSGMIAVAALVASTLTLLRTRAPATVEPNLLAVAPFDVLDPSLQLWREGLVDVLSRDLDGAGPIRTVSQSLALKHWAGRADPASAAALGERTGAGLVVFGTLARRGPDSVSLRAAVLDRSRNEAEPDLEVVGDERRIGELADSLGVRVLRVLGRGRPVGSVRHVSLASRSLPALKEFLRGEQFYRRGLWDSALVHYDRAVAQDSTFGLALWRMALVLWWNPATSGAYRDRGEYQRRAVALNHGLSPRDSSILAAASLNDLGDPSPLFNNRARALAVLEEAARRYPNDPEIWYILGEYRYHEDPPLGGIPAPALQAFDRAIAIDSGFAPAYEHVVQLSMKLGRPDLARQYARAYPALDPTDVNAPSLRLVALVLDSGGIGARTVTRAIQTASVGALFRAGLEHLGSWPDSAETAVALLRELARGGHAIRGADAETAPWVADSLMWPQYLAAVLAFRGHLRQAYETDRRLLLNLAASPYSEFQDPFLSLSLLGVIPDSMAGAAFRRSPRHRSGLPWWLARGDTASLARFAERAAQVAGRPKTPGPGLRARLLGMTATGYLALARGDSTEALRLLESIPDTLCMAASCFHVKLTLARLYAARGEYRRAGELLDRWRWAADGPFFAIATLELGRIAERLGQQEKATESYQFVTDVWQRADPELQPYVTEAREALARLTRE